MQVSVLSRTATVLKKTAIFRCGRRHRLVRRDPDGKSRGFKVIAWRWIVERTLGRLMHHRRLARDYETLTARSEAMIQLAMVDLMSRRLTCESTPNWRGT